jgi:hypothetical protein
MKNNSQIKVVSYNFPKLLEKLTKVKGWKETSGIQTGVGVDYFYTNKNNNYVYINIDQSFMTISLDGENIFSGDDEIAKF